MAQVEINMPAPDFELADFRARLVRLSQFKGSNHVYLVFNRGFA